MLLARVRLILSVEMVCLMLSEAQLCFMLVEVDHVHHLQAVHVPMWRPGAIWAVTSNVSNKVESYGMYGTHEPN
jgi:hypothetical protein